MTRLDHNANPGDIVRRNAFDPDCAACLLSVAHTYADHDRSLARKRATVTAHPVHVPKPTRKRGKRK